MKTLKLHRLPERGPISAIESAATEATNNRAAVAYLRSILRDFQEGTAGDWQAIMRDALATTTPKKLRGR